MIRNQKVTPVLSFDIEDWFHLIEVDATSDTSGWDSFPSIVVDRTRQILDLLSEFNVRATFFMLGWVADRHPELVPMIAERGHEIGTHSFWHRKVFELTPDVFRDDLRQSIEVIEDQHPGVKVKGFRAPSFSITPGTEWAFDVMKELGIEYDASLFPANRAHGGYPCALVPQSTDLAQQRYARRATDERDGDWAVSRLLFWRRLFSLVSLLVHRKLLCQVRSGGEAIGRLPAPA